MSTRLAAIAAAMVVTVCSCKKEEKQEPVGASGGESVPSSRPVVTKEPAPVAVPEPDPTDGPVLDRELLERVARQLLLEARSSGPLTGMFAKEHVSARFGMVSALLDNADEHVMWGVLQPGQSVDPEVNQVVQVPPLVLARAYLSCFEFTGTHAMRQEGEFGVLEMGAKFRAGLPLGEYPHALWHSADEWKSYAQTSAIVLAFYHGSFVAAYRKPGPIAASAAGEGVPVWNGEWVWKDGGAEQPRGASVEVSLSTSNPHIKSVGAAYKRLEPMLAAQRCFECHVPSNPAGASVLVLLRSPAAAMAAKDALAAVLRENSMPPQEVARNAAEGIGDERARQEMIDAADAWGKAVHDALDFEKTLRTPSGNGATPSGGDAGGN